MAKSQWLTIYDKGIKNVFQMVKFRFYFVYLLLRLTNRLLFD